MEVERAPFSRFVSSMQGTTWALVSYRGRVA